jgi:hypothetical protein
MKIHNQLLKKIKGWNKILQNVMKKAFLKNFQIILEFLEKELEFQ